MTTWLLDAANGDGTALRRLRHHTTHLLADRGHPLHVASITTAALVGWNPDGGYPDSLVNHPELFEVLTNRTHRPALLPPGVFVEVTTESLALGHLYGELVCSHLDPEPDAYDAHGSLHTHQLQRWRAVVDFCSVPEGLQPGSDDNARLERLKRKGRWLTPNGHVTYWAVDDGTNDLIRYCQWLTQPDRALVRGQLPADPARLAELASSLVDELAAYRSTVVRFGNWLWLREPFEALLGAPTGAGRLNRDELARRFEMLCATFGTDQVRRTIAHEIAEEAACWTADDRVALIQSTAWVSALFTANAFVDERLEGGPSLAKTRDGTVRLTPDPVWGLAGLWQVDLLDPDTIKQLRDRAREEAEEGVAVAGRELQAIPAFPFCTRLTLEEFEDAHLQLPKDALAQLSDGDVTVRLAFTPAGRFASRPVAVASTGRPDTDGRLRLEWPALIRVGTTLEGRVRRRGRLVELTPTAKPLPPVVP